jgi:hypothetical protein
MKPYVLNMKTSVYVLFLSLAFLSCEKKVDLLPIDILTGGTSKDWIIESYRINDDELPPEDLAMSNDITFEKRFKPDNSYDGTYYIWHSLQGESSNYVSQVKKFTEDELHLHDVFADGSVNPTPSIWKVKIVNHDNIILSQRLEDERQTIDDGSGQQIPNPTYGMVTTHTLTLVSIDGEDLDIEINL